MFILFSAKMLPSKWKWFEKRIFILFFSFIRLF